jgi:ATP-dependent helicase/nuclease subunit A
VSDRRGGPLWRLTSEQTAKPEPRRGAIAAKSAGVPRPDWMDRPVASEPRLAMPLTPSRLAPLTDPTGAPAFPEPPPPAPRARLDGQRFLRGTLTHALLEHLPEIGASNQEAAAAAFLASRAPFLDGNLRRQIVTETLRVVRDPRFAALFGPSSRAEVQIAARLPRPDGASPPLEVAGTIDRLVEMADQVLIVDYKTNRPPPRQVEEVAETYLLQLAAYRLAVAALFPQRAVRAALLWTDGARIMEIPRAILDARAERLWALGQP